MPYNHGKHLVPYDTAVHEFSTGLTRVEIAKSHGINFTVVSDIGVNEGIDAIRNLLNRCWFVKKHAQRGFMLWKMIAENGTNVMDVGPVTLYI